MECPLQSEPHRPLRLLSLPHFIMLSDTGRGSDHALSHVNRPFTSQSGCHFFPQKARGFLGFGLDVPHAVVQLLSNVWLCATPWTAARQASLSFTVSQSLPKLLSVELVVPSNPLILCCLLLLPSIFLSIRVLIPSPICPVLPYQSHQPGSEQLWTCLPSLQGPTSSWRLGYRLARCCILGSCHIVKFWWGVNEISYSFISYMLSACVG